MIYLRKFNCFVFNTIIIYIVFSIVLTSCEQKKEYILYDKKKDSLFIVNKWGKGINWYINNPSVKIILNDKLILSFDNERHLFRFFIKEITPDSIRRFGFTINNVMPSTFRYDSTLHDLICISKHNYSSISERYYNNPKLRKKIKKYNEALKIVLDIRKLEKVINEMEVFKNLSFEDELAIDILKKLFIISQVQIVNLPKKEGDHYDWNLVIEMKNVYEIKTKEDFDLFKKRLDEPALYEKNHPIYIYSSMIKNDLKTQIENIKKDYQDKSVFYFYTVNDYKLFRLKIKVENGKIFLIKNHINGAYLWTNWHFPFIP